MKPLRGLPLTDETVPSSAAAADSDEALMRRFTTGDSQAFDVLFERYARPLHRYLQRLSGSPAVAEDLTQLTFLSMVRARARFQPGARVRPWLYAIATNVAHDWRRRGRLESLTPDGALPADVATEELPLKDEGLERAVQRALLQVPEKLRVPILMHRFEGLSFREIAEALGVTETAVKLRAHRGYQRLRVLLAPLQGEL